MECKLDKLVKIYPCLAPSENIDDTLCEVYKHYASTEDEISVVDSIFPNLPYYHVIKACVGTRPYLSGRLEMDIEDVFAYMIVREDELDDFDVVKKYGKSKSKSFLKETLDILEMEDFYASW